jgi:hypothetical protein
MDGAHIPVALMFCSFSRPFLQPCRPFRLFDETATAALTTLETPTVEHARAAGPIPNWLGPGKLAAERLSERSGVLQVTLASRTAFANSSPLHIALRVLFPPHC